MSRRRAPAVFYRLLGGALLPNERRYKLTARYVVRRLGFRLDRPCVRLRDTRTLEVIHMTEGFLRKHYTEIKS